MTEIFKFNLPELNLNPADVDRILGGSDAERELIHMLCMELFSEIDDTQGICGGFARFDSVQIQDDRGLKIASRTFDVGNRIARQLRDVEEAVLFVATAGQRITDWAQHWLQVDLLKGMVADIIASLIPEAVMQNLHKALNDRMQDSGYRLSNAYSPGYCDWPVSDQFKLFALLPDRFCGVSLNAHALMLPLKSVSGVIGIGRNVQYLESVCALCEQLDCAYRRPIEKFASSISYEE